MLSKDTWERAHQAMHMGKMVEAERLFMDGLLKVVTQFETPLAILPAYRGLSDLYQSEGRMHLSLRLHREMLRIYEQEFGPQHTTVAIASLEMGMLCRKSGDALLANKFFRNGVMLLWQRLDSFASDLSAACTELPEHQHPENECCQCWQKERCTFKHLVETIQGELNAKIGFGELAQCIVDDTVEGCVRELAKHFNELLKKAQAAQLPCGLESGELLEICIGLGRLEHGLPATTNPATTFIKMRGARRS